MAPNAWIPNRYPQSRRSDHVDVYKSKAKGTVKVPDPYNWLEENSEETARWVTEQEKYTREYLHSIPDWKRIEADIRKVTDYPKFSAPSFKGDKRWYWHYNSGLQAQSVIWRSKTEQLPDFTKEETEIGEVFFDPNLLSEDGTASIRTSASSKDGKYFAYGISRSGSDLFTIYVRTTTSPLVQKEGEPRTSHDDGRLPEEIRFAKFCSIIWTHDNKGFFYQRYPERVSHGDASLGKVGTETTSDIDAELYYHRVGTPQSDDILVIKDPEHPDWMWSVSVSELDGRYLELCISKDSSRKYLIWVTDLKENEIGPNLKWIKLVNEFDASYDIIGNDGTLFYLVTNKDAPREKIVTIDIADPNFIRKDLVPERKDSKLEIGVVIRDHLVIVYKRDVKDEIYIHSLKDGKHITRLSSEFVGEAAIWGKREYPWFFATLTSFTNPSLLYQYRFDDALKEGEKWRALRTTEVKGLLPEEFISKQVWYESKDGTKIPMFIVRHKDTPLDGTAPALQYGYGGFNISINPFFSGAILEFVQKCKGVLAVPNIRGGGEFGKEWHLAGTRERKVNCFDDFMAASEYLVKNKYAAADKLAINGGSNGGLLVAACVNRAPPGTFGAAVAEVGVLDLLKFNQYTIGHAWTSDYGDPQNPEDFDFIYPISPLHNVPTDRVLPPTILFTADHDDRVVPLHSLKHAATLQYLRAENPHPLLIRLETKAGHGSGKSTEQMIISAADKFAFIVHTLGLEWED
ncbi:hypothetical protein BDM02DRAFT_3149057 [Thelephora ganbajun]|uniref:Uncharacterized protein n=1 Tax=Thelephora ganbajun TaxID=370292 RepID=A0ACB6Z6V6_THEGA|nr:hypothetical protein BDM02DRAFT_3149057 [Thelephora ganbajun]